MKTKIFLLMFSILLMSISCEKSDSVNDQPTELVTFNDLDGSWGFESFYFDNYFFKDCTTMKMWAGLRGYTSNYSFIFSNGNKCVVTDNCDFPSSSASFTANIVFKDDKTYLQLFDIYGSSVLNQILTYNKATKTITMTFNNHPGILSIKKL